MYIYIFVFDQHHVKRSLLFNRDSTLLVSGCNDATMKIWRLEGTHVVKNARGQKYVVKNTLVGHAAWVSSASFSPDDVLILR
jgi:WD40 repeat protein